MRGVLGVPEPIIMGEAHAYIPKYIRFPAVLSNYFLFSV